MFIYKEVGKDHEDVAVPDHDGRIVKDVIAGVTQSFLEEGVDISVIFYLTGHPSHKEWNLNLVSQLTPS